MSMKNFIDTIWD